MSETFILPTAVAASFPMNPCHLVSWAKDTGRREKNGHIAGRILPSSEKLSMSASDAMVRTKALHLIVLDMHFAPSNGVNCTTIQTLASTVLWKPYHVD